MAAQQATPQQFLLFGTICTLGGAYFTAVGLGLLPIPGGPANLHAPLWVLMLIGAIFLLAGLMLLIQRFGHANADGELPPGAPGWLRVVQYVFGVAVFASFAMIGSWIAFAPGEREFSASVPFVSFAANEIFGRVMFGFGAVICWLCTLAFAVCRAPKLSRPAPGSGVTSA